MNEIIRVDTIDLDGRAWRWTDLVDRIDTWLTHAATLEASHSPQHEALVSTIATIRRDARVVRDECAALAHAFARAADSYSQAEADVAIVMQRASDVAWWLIGRLLPVLLVLFAPAAVGAIATNALTESILNRISPRGKRQLDALKGEALTKLMTTPAVVKAIERTIGSSDEAVLGLIGLPVAATAALAGAGVTTTAGTSRLLSRVNQIATNPADALAASAGSGRDVETSVRVTSSTSARAPRDFAELIQRIPTDRDAGAQTRIERYGDTYVVYVAGTVEGSLGASTQPWDMSSNLAAVGGDPAASEDAVKKMMAGSGIRPQDPVIFVGHSQGGIVAMRLAQQPDVNATAVVTAGAPIHHIPPPPGTVVIAFEHVDDLVPVLGGPVTTAGTVYVSRQALASDSVTLAGDAFPAHRLDTYVETARRASVGLDPRLAPVQRQLNGLAQDGEATQWRATRTHPVADTN